MKVDVFVVFTPLCKIECEHFETFFEKHGHGNSEGCIRHGGIQEHLENFAKGCPHFPQEILKKFQHALIFHQAYGVLCYKYTGRYEGAYMEVVDED